MARETVTKTRTSARTAAGKSSALGARSLKEIREKKPSVLPTFSPWLIAGLFVVLAMIFHSSILFGDKFLWEDFIEQEFPFRTLAASSLAHGILPHWDPYIFAGMPFLADIQVAFWYPFNLLQSLFVSSGYLSPVVMEWFILMHYALAGFGMFWFVRKIMCADDWSATFAGIAYAFSGYIVAQAIHQMIVYHMALFPFAAYFFVRGVDSWKHAIAGGIVLGVMYLAGHPQSTLYFTFTLALLAVYELVHRARHKSGPLNTATVLRLAIPVAIGLGVFAIQFLPSQELAALSRRDVITYEKSVEGSLTWGHLYTFVLPRLFGLTNGAGDAKVPYWNGPYYNSWETAIYIGVFPLFFAIMAALVGRKRKYVPFFAGLAIFALLFALGDQFFLYKLFFNLPLFSKLRTPARMSMVLSFSLCALSGVGLSEALRTNVTKWGGSPGLAVRGLLALPWLLAIAGLIHATSFFASAPAEADASIAWAAGLAAFPVIAMLVITLMHYRQMIRGTLLAALVIAATAIELFSYGMSVNAGTEDPRQAFREQPELVQMLKQDATKEMTRARTRMGNQMLVKRNQGAYDKLQLIEGYNPLVLQRVSPDMANTEASADLMNIKWSIMPPRPGERGGFGARATFMPRVAMYYKAEVLEDAQALARLKQDSAFDYRNTILLEEPPTLPLGNADPTASAKITQYSENTIATSVTTASNGMLFFSEVYYPAWKAYVDGKPTKLYRAFTSLRAVEVPSGSHIVELRYESDAFKTGSMITILTLLLSGGALAFFVVRDRKKAVVAEDRESERHTAATESLPEATET